MIAAGYEDGNDAATRRDDPMFKLALDRLPSDDELCSQSTISRVENLPDRRALVEQYCGSPELVEGRSGAKAPRPRYRRHPRLREGRLFERVHGGQQLRLFNTHDDDYGFQPVVVFDGEGRFVSAPRVKPVG
ncbi:MAG: transposase [Stellaceae bacterium]